MITLRLNDDLEKSIEKISKDSGISKSELIRKSVVEYMAKFQNKNAWELGRDLFGKYKSGKRNLSTSAGTILREKLRKKRRK